MGRDRTRRQEEPAVGADTHKLRRYGYLPDGAPRLCNLTSPNPDSALTRIVGLNMLTSATTRARVKARLIDCLVASKTRPTKGNRDASTHVRKQIKIRTQHLSPLSLCLVPTNNSWQWPATSLAASKALCIITAGIPMNRYYTLYKTLLVSLLR